MNFYHKYINYNIAIEDQEEALKDPYWAFLFARKNIPESDFKALQVKACEEYFWAYYFALDIPGADIRYCQKHACKDPKWAYYFALDIPGADIQYCFKHIFP